MQIQTNVIKWLQKQREKCTNDYGDIEKDIEFLRESSEIGMYVIGLIRDTGSEIATFSKDDLSNLSRVLYTWKNTQIYYTVKITEISDGNILGEIQTYKPNNKFITELMQKFEKLKSKGF